jgi:hypothetical protein
MDHFTKTGSGQTKGKSHRRLETAGFVSMQGEEGVDDSDLGARLPAGLVSGAGACDESAWAWRLVAPIAQALLRRYAFFEFSLCLSRACLGKMIVFIYKCNATTRDVHPLGGQAGQAALSSYNIAQRSQRTVTAAT